MFECENFDGKYIECVYLKIIFMILHLFEDFYDRGVGNSF